MFRLLTRDRSFPLLWVGQVTSALGDWLAFVVLPLYLYTITGSALSVSILMACRVIPAILLGPVAGPLVDRWSKRRLMMAMDSLRGLLFIGLLFVSSPWQVYLITVLAASASALFGPALRSYIPRIVEREALGTANSALSTARQLMMLLGPALGGVLMALWGTQTVLLLDALTFFASLLALSLAGDGLGPRDEAARTDAVAQGPQGPQGESRAQEAHRTSPGWMESVREGIGYIKGAPDIMLVLASGLIGSTGYGMFNVLFPLIASTVYAENSSQAYGLIMTALGAGLTIGSAAAGWLLRRTRFPRLYGAAILISGGALLLFGMSGLLFVALPALAVTGIGDGLQEVSRITFLQTRVDGAYHGRVFAFTNSVMMLPLLTGMMAAGLLAPLWGARGVALTAAGLILAAGLLYRALARRYHREAGASAAA